MSKEPFRSCFEQFKPMEDSLFSELTVSDIRKFRSALMDQKDTEKSDSTGRAGSEPFPVTVVSDCGLLSVILPSTLPQRPSHDKSGDYAKEVRSAIRNYYDCIRPPRYDSLVLVYEFIFSADQHCGLFDHDTRAIRHIQKELEHIFLAGGASAQSAVFQHDHCGDEDCTRIWILTPEEYMKWISYRANKPVKEGT